MTDSTNPAAAMGDGLAELLPCPWCGGSATIEPKNWAGRDFIGVFCNECLVFQDSRSRTNAEAIATWNQREGIEPAAALTVGQVKAVLRDKLDLSPELLADMEDNLTETAVAVILAALRPAQPAAVEVEAMERLHDSLSSAPPDATRAFVSLDDHRTILAALSAAKPIAQAKREAFEEAAKVVKALSRAKIRSYSHKQLDISLDVASSDDLTTIVLSVALAQSEGEVGG